MQRIRIRLAAAALALAVTAPALAAVAPKKPSDLVALLTISSAYPTYPGTGYRLLDERENSDGTATPWSGPLAGRVLIITHVQISSLGWAPGHLVSLVLIAGNEAIVALGDVYADANGQALIDRTFPTGVTVKSGVALCAGDVSGGTTTTNVHGFLMDDR